MSADPTDSFCLDVENARKSNDEIAAVALAHLNTFLILVKQARDCIEERNLGLAGSIFEVARLDYDALVKCLPHG